MSGAVGVKICGLTEEVGVAACIECRADWIGFNFFSRSPRYVTPERARGLAAIVKASAFQPVIVGLFVEPSEQEIERALAHAPLAAMQLYASPERALVLRERFGLPTWLSCPVSDAADLPAEGRFERLVVESRPPKDATRPGGNGVAFPWAITADWAAPSPWMLAGGLRPDTVAQAIAESGAVAVDVASGVERSPGVKDPHAIRRFIAAARDENATESAFPLESRGDAAI
ncbi:phosphoribosylanthranilate isomerase [Acetobacter sacchari]|uniref:N-(5'-phosphoribosyl)anthranilate isomerase n=1 Tax=Acetobacter sacchari TaxID=2661687 RepID=A0ABS3LYE2_9PROT|nr:phosphoribosylanthranilate isomerase [Acetobacter sacchari]